MNRTKHIIEAPINLGLKEPVPGREPGVATLPAWLRQHGLYDYISPKTVLTIEPPSYQWVPDPESGVNNTEAIIRYARQLAHAVASKVSQHGFPVVIGGDCSILIGTMLGLKKVGTYGLFFLDGHTDFMGPELSETGGAAGMDLAIVTGYGHHTLTNIDHQQPYVKETLVWCVGNREYNASYVQAIKDSHVHYESLASLREQGALACVRQFLAMMEASPLRGFWIHVDVDVLSDEVMPAVDSRQPGGLSYPEFNVLLKTLLQSEQAAGLQITILDPTLDPSGEITDQFIRNIGPIIAEL